MAHEQATELTGPPDEKTDESLDDIPLREILNDKSLVDEVPVEFVPFIQAKYVLDPHVADHKSIRSLMVDNESARANLRELHNYVATLPLDPEAEQTIHGWLRLPVQTPVHLPPTVFVVPRLRIIQRMVQKAMELEWTTIPVYLSAMYSIARDAPPGGQFAVDTVLRPIVYQEMKHMGLTCNLLNAIGGTPNFSSRCVPQYPGKLPIKCLPNLRLEIGNCSKDRIRYQFMQIEQPEYTCGYGMDYDISPIEVDAETGKNVFYVTYEKSTEETKDKEITNSIGQIYFSILHSLQALGDGIFSPNRRQLVKMVGPENFIFPINNILDARRAILEIVEEGEGTILSGKHPIVWEAKGAKELAHYYLFLSLYVGELITKMEEIEQPIGSNLKVFKFYTDGNPVGYEDWMSSRYTEEEIQAFSERYTSLTLSLGATFSNEYPTTVINQSVDDMIALEAIYQETVQTKDTNPEWNTA